MRLGGKEVRSVHGGVPNLKETQFSSPRALERRVDRGWGEAVFCCACVLARSSVAFIPHCKSRNSVLKKCEGPSCKFNKWYNPRSQPSQNGVVSFVRSRRRRLPVHHSSAQHQVRHKSLRGHRAARHACLRHACLRHACLRRACLRHACLRYARCHRLIARRSARVKRAGPLTPRRRPPPSLPARCAATPRPARLLGPATLRHPVTLCHSAPTPSVLRSRWPTRTACHLSPSARGSTLPVLPRPLVLRRIATSQTLNYQGRRPAFATTWLPRSHRTLF